MAKNDVPVRFIPAWEGPGLLIDVTTYSNLATVLVDGKVVAHLALIVDGDRVVCEVSSSDEGPAYAVRIGELPEH